MDTSPAASRMSRCAFAALAAAPVAGRCSIPSSPEQLAIETPTGPMTANNATVAVNLLRITIPLKSARLAERRTLGFSPERSMIQGARPSVSAVELGRLGILFRRVCGLLLARVRRRTSGRRVRQLALNVLRFGQVSLHRRRGFRDQRLQRRVLRGALRALHERQESLVDGNLI